MNNQELLFEIEAEAEVAKSAIKYGLEAFVEELKTVSLWKPRLHS